MLIIATLFVATTSIANAQEIKTNEAPQTTSLETLVTEQKNIENAQQLEATKLQNDLDAAKQLEQEQKIAEAQHKADLQAQKQIEKENKAELKRQKEILKSQKRVAKQTVRLQKAQDKYNSKNGKYIQLKAAGKLTPIDELKTKSQLLDLQTDIKKQEIELKRVTMEFETLTK